MDLGGGVKSPPIFAMRIFVDQRAVSRNSSSDEQEPVFIVERDDGTQMLAHSVLINGPARLVYDKASQPRAWLEADDITEIGP